MLFRSREILHRAGTQPGITKMHDDAAPESQTGSQTKPQTEAQAGTEPGLEQMPGFWLRRASQQVRALFAEECGQDGLTPEQYTILLLVRQSDALDQTQLARLACLDLATTGNIVRRLVERGRLARCRNPRDGRAWTLTLTAEGLETLDRARQRGRRVRERFLGRLQDDEAAEFMRLIRKLVETD